MHSFLLLKYCPTAVVMDTHGNYTLKSDGVIQTVKNCLWYMPEFNIRGHDLELIYEYHMDLHCMSGITE